MSLLWLNKLIFEKAPNNFFYVRTYLIILFSRELENRRQRPEARNIMEDKVEREGELKVAIHMREAAPVMKEIGGVICVPERHRCIPGISQRMGLGLGLGLLWVTTRRSNQLKE